MFTRHLPGKPHIRKVSPGQSIKPGSLSLILLAWFLAGCVGYTPPPPTETPFATGTQPPADTPAPSQTDEPTATATLIPTLTPEPEITDASLVGLPEDLPLRMGEVQQVGEGGFSFQPVVGYDVNVLPGQATLVSKDGATVVSLSGGDVAASGALEGIMDRLLAKVSEDFEKFEAGDTYPITVDESEGLAADVNAELVGKPVEGLVAIVAPSDSQLFYAFAFTLEEPDEFRWESEGSEVFDAVMGSVHFYELNGESTP